MSTDETRRTGEEGSLEDIREASAAVEKSTAQVVVEKVLGRLQILVSIVVLSITTYLLYLVDGGLSTDAWIFAGLAVGLLAYFLVTLRTDVRME